MLGQVSSAFTDSIEFNQDSNLFAVGGVTQKIKFYDYYSVIDHNAAFPFPSLVVESVSYRHYLHLCASLQLSGVIGVWLNGVCVCMCEDNEINYQCPFLSFPVVEHLPCSKCPCR